MPSPEDDSRDMEKTEGSRCEFQGFRGRKSLESRQQWLFKPWGVASQASLGGEMGAEKAAGACGEQLTSVLGSILGGCCPTAAPSPRGCCVGPAPPCPAASRCDLGPLAQDSLHLETS